MIFFSSGLNRIKAELVYPNFCPMKSEMTPKQFKPFPSMAKLSKQPQDNYHKGLQSGSQSTLNIFGYIRDYQNCDGMHIVQNVRQRLRSNVFTQTVSGYFLQRYWLLFMILQ